MYSLEIENKKKPLYLQPGPELELLTSKENTRLAPTS